MQRLSRFLAILGLVAALFPISVIYWGIPPTDPVIAVFLSSISVFMALAAATLATLLVIVLWIKREKPRPIATSLVTAAAFILSVGWLVSFFDAG